MEPCRCETHWSGRDDEMRYWLNALAIAAVINLTTAALAETPAETATVIEKALSPLVAAAEKAKKDQPIKCITVLSHVILVRSSLESSKKTYKPSPNNPTY